MNLETITTQMNRFALEHTPLAAAKYLDFYPIHDRSKSNNAFWGKHATLSSRTFGKIARIFWFFIKDEGANPTGVFKDRGSLVEITKALEMGAKAICVASTGNILLRYLRMRVVLVCRVTSLFQRGTPSGSFRKRWVMAENFFKFVERMPIAYDFRKSFQNEITFILREITHFEQREQNRPLLKSLSNFAGKCLTPFSFRLVVEQILRGLPKDFENFWTGIHWCSSTDDRCSARRMWHDLPCISFGKWSFYTGRETKYRGKCCWYWLSAWWYKNVFVRFESRMEWQKLLLTRIFLPQHILSKQESVFTEPSGAIPVAVLLKLLQKEFWKEMILLSVSPPEQGLKIQKPLSNLFLNLLHSMRILSILNIFYRVGLLKCILHVSHKRGRGISNTSQWKGTSTLLEEEFSHSPDDILLENILQEVDSFLHRGKIITKADLLNMLEEAIENTSIPESPLKIIDFSVEDSFQNPPFAKVILDFSGTSCSGESVGVGPVDALIKAVKNALTSASDFWTELIDFHVKLWRVKKVPLQKFLWKCVIKRGNQVHCQSK